MLVGGLVGGIVVWLFRWVILMVIGLYFVFVMLFGVLVFGFVVNVDGSGFLVIFIMGVVIGNSCFLY